MVTVEDVQSEVVVGDDPTEHKDFADKLLEVQVEELRGVVRELVQEELERFLRTESRS